MKDIGNVLQRTFTKEFYRLNAMFFLITIGFAFGFMSGVEHKALAAFITSSPVWTSVVAVLWSVYAFKIYSFNNQTCRSREMSFVNSLSLLPVTAQLWSVLRVTLNQFMPAMAYGVFLIATALRNKIISSAISIAGIILIIVSILTFLLYRRIGAVYMESRISFFKVWSDKTFQKSFVQFFYEWLVRNQPGMLITVKIFGCLVIFAVCALYQYDQYDYRLLAMGCLAAVSANVVLISQFIIFENHTFSLVRNLPITISKRLIYLLASLVTICLPEMILLTRNFPEQLSLYNLSEIVVFSFSVLMLGHRSLLWRNNEVERISSLFFISFMILIMLILFSVPLLIMSSIILAIALFRIAETFYEFEQMPAAEKK